ncbi:MAG: zf-HC2 domain-containing protein, partial [Planctomycetes bacterium]|nr:zf-HC2 domain-containing protein [Planctomycetota bacterium]
MSAAVGCLLLLLVVGRSLLSTSPPPHALSHADVIELQQQFIRGELDEEQTRMVEAHIKVCPACHHLLDDRDAFEKHHQGA